MQTFDRATIERALDSGRLFVAMNNGRYWRARRNGQTKIWKTRPDDFYIPFKYGLKLCGQITPRIANSDFFKIEEE